MIFRRIKAHFEKENWFAVGVDFFIVVVGVFVGLQVQTWNQAQNHKQTEAAYIERIREDLSANIDDVNQRVAYFTQVRSHAVKALDALELSPEVLGESFVIDVYQASNFLPRVFGRDSYDEVLSVGANQGISDVEVRKRLANFYRSIHAQVQLLSFTTPYRDIIRRQLPYKVTKAIRETCNGFVSTGEHGQPIIMLPEHCEPGITDQQITQAVTAVLALDLREELTLRLIDLDSKLKSLDMISSRVDLLDDYLEAVQQ